MGRNFIWRTTGIYIGPVLFNIFMCDLFLICNDIDFVNYADDNTPFVSGNTPKEVKESLNMHSLNFFNGFQTIK